MLRRLWPLLLCLLACGWALLVFDWAAIAAAFRRFDLGHFLLVGVPACLLFFAMRSLRWAAISGARFTPRLLWDIHLQSTLALTAATVTPMQAGEAIKLKFAHDRLGRDYASLTAAFGMERLADLAVVLGLGALGFGLRGAAPGWLAAGAVALALAALLAPALLRRLAMAPLPAALAHRLAPLAAYRVAPWRMALLGLCSLGNWLAVILLWQGTLAAAGVSLGLGDCALAVALVALAVTASLVPGGFGVAEVSTRAVLVWLGVEPGLAEAGAVLLRMIMLLVIALGLLHGLAWRPARPAPVQGGGGTS